MAPTLSLKNDPGYQTIIASVSGDTTLKFGVTGMLGDGNRFTNVKVLKRYDYKDWLVVVDSSISTDTLSFDHTFKPRNFLGVEQWSISAEDDLGLIASATVTVNTMNIEKTGVKLYEVCREQENAYDLLNDRLLDIVLSGNEVPDSADIDMVTAFQCDTGLVLGWSATAQSNTRYFPLDSTYIYDKVVREDLMEVFENLVVAYDGSGELAGDELYAAEIRGGESYAIIQVDKPVYDTAGYNYIQFRYRK